MQTNVESGIYGDSHVLYCSQKCGGSPIFLKRFREHAWTEFTGDAKRVLARILWSARAGRQANGKVVVDVPITRAVLRTAHR